MSNGRPGAREGGLRLHVTVRVLPGVRSTKVQFITKVYQQRKDPGLHVSWSDVKSVLPLVVPPDFLPSLEYIVL